MAYVDAQSLARGPFDKTDLLLAGQTQAEIAVVRHAGFVVVAAGFDSGIDFVKLFELGGGMPTRVSYPKPASTKFCTSSAASAIRHGPGPSTARCRWPVGLLQRVRDAGNDAIGAAFGSAFGLCLTNQDLAVSRQDHHPHPATDFDNAPR